MTAIAVQPRLSREPTIRWKMSFEEFLAWDGNGNPELHAEWVNGEVVPMVSIDVRHTLISTFIISVIGFACRRRNIGTLLFDPFIMRPAANGNGRSPDVMIVRDEHKERIQRIFVNGPADIVVEIVSPSSFKTDYFVKAAEYRRAGVPEYWIIDPLQEQTMFLLLDSDGEYAEPQMDENGLFRSPGLNGLAIDARWFHQDPLPDELEIWRAWGILPAA